MRPERGQCEDLGPAVQESDLVKYCGVGAVKQMRLEAVFIDDRTKYRVYVKGTWRPDECLLITFRKKPREWSSLDNFMRHAREVYRFKGRLLLDMKFGDEIENR